MVNVDFNQIIILQHVNCYNLSCLEKFKDEVLQYSLRYDRKFSEVTTKICIKFIMKSSPSHFINV